jgi:predicted GNAT superfamily acetyltransferase
MLGVRPDSRDGGIGNALKWAQYDRARQLGNPLITWTFDPLEARNAHLNLNKLGVRVRRYYVNLYGTNTSSPLHSGVGTDRLLAEWHVRETPLQSIAGRIAPESLPESIRALDSTATANPTHRRPSQPILVLTSDLVAVETPAQTQRMKETDLALARDWREATRRTLKHYLDHGYSICGLWVLDQEPIRTFYCLRADRASN